MCSNIYDINITDIPVDEGYKKINVKYKNQTLLELFVSSCKYCHTPIVNVNKRKRCCDSKECKRKWRSEAELERQHTPYQKPIASLYTYISTTKANFRKKVNDEPYLVAKFDAKRKEVIAIVKQELERREELKLPPDDDEMRSFLLDNKHRMLFYMKRLLVEYENDLE